MDATGSSASIIDAHAAESAIHSGSSSSCVRPSRSMVTWRTAPDRFAFERTTRALLPCQGCHRYETITSVPWAFRRALVPRLAAPPVPRRQRAPAAGDRTTEPGADCGRVPGWRSPPPIPTRCLSAHQLRAPHSANARAVARRSEERTGRSSCRRILHRWLVFPSIRASLADPRRWLRTKMTLLICTGPSSKLTKLPQVLSSQLTGNRRHDHVDHTCKSRMEHGVGLGRRREPDRANSHHCRQAPPDHG